MPEISRFLGIVIRMFYNDHAAPHFHPYYGDKMARVNIRTLAAMSSTLSPRVLGLVIEWAKTHQKALLTNWERARQGRPLRKIEPLE